MKTTSTLLEFDIVDLDKPVKKKNCWNQYKGEG